MKDWGRLTAACCQTWAYLYSVWSAVCSTTWCCFLCGFFFFNTEINACRLLSEKNEIDRNSLGGMQLSQGCFFISAFCLSDVFFKFCMPLALAHSLWCRITQCLNYLGKINVVVGSSQTYCVGDRIILWCELFLWSFCAASNFHSRGKVAALGLSCMFIWCK